MRREGHDDVVARARKGDEEAWRTLFLRHGERLVQWLRSLPPGDACTTADDIAAEAWLVAASKIRHFRGDEADFAAWLFHIAYLVSAGRRRTAVRRRTFPLAVETASEAVWGTAADTAPESDGADSARHLLGRLSEREGQVLGCIDVLGLDVPTTGRLLGISDGAVRVAHHRAIARLRLLLVRTPGEAM